MTGRAGGRSAAAAAGLAGCGNLHPTWHRLFPDGWCGAAGGKHRSAPQHTQGATPTPLGRGTRAAQSDQPGDHSRQYGCCRVVRTDLPRSLETGRYILVPPGHVHPRKRHLHSDCARATTCTPAAPVHAPANGRWPGWLDARNRPITAGQGFRARDGPTPGAATLPERPPTALGHLCAAECRRASNWHDLDPELPR